ncbi:MAG: TonB-dependent receptor [Cyclobacteriaceae bacterium]|nr:TonB-dependent receptor [Cyclobacteriaceae bacterium]
MNKFYRKALVPLLILLCGPATLMAQTTSITGTVKDGTSGESLAGVNIVVKGRVIGTISNTDGQYNLKVNQPPPFTLVFSFIGYATQEFEVTQATSTIDVTLAEQTLLGQEIVVSASRMEESILQSPVSIEKMDILGVQSTASENYYKGLINMKGLDMTQSSINFQIINARGFNSTGNTRFVQLTDGMDTQAPALNFPIGNLNGPSELDVESVEFIPGAASALYGPNAFNGILLVNSKSPFEYQGLSAFAKYGFNHAGGGVSYLDNGGASVNPIGPGYAEPMFEGALRYAKAFNNRFAFKIAVSYMQATDWYGTNLRDKNPERQGGLSFNPGADRVHAFGDEVANSLGLVRLSLAPALAGTSLASFVPFLPDQIVSRTPYEERYLVDYGAKNLKANVGLNYRITDKVELLYLLNYGGGTSVYTGAQRYSLKDFNIQQHKLELKGSNFFLRGYTTIEDSGDSYIADLTGILINDAWKSNSAWFRDYSVQYLTSLAQQGFNPGGGTQPTAAQQENAHRSARNTADVGRLLPGTAAFEQAKKTATGSVIPFGSLFNDATKLYHVEGQYNFKNQIKFMELMVGGSYRLYDLNSNGTIFADTTGNDITIQEIGAYAQASKKLFNDKLKLTGSLRWDKNENFDAQLNPRISGVYSINPQQNFRVSYQTGFRMPTSQNQHIDLNAVSARLIGGLPQYAAARNVFQYAYDLRSVTAYTAAVAAGAAAGNATAIGDPNNLRLLVPVSAVAPVKPEQVQSIEVGYKGLVANKLMIDVVYYQNTFNDFIASQFVRKAAGVIDINGMPTDVTYNFDPRTEQNIRNAQTLLTPITTINRENTFSIPTNVDRTLKSSGFALGLEYSLPKGYKLGGNYNYNKLKDASQLAADGFLAEFNTPENKFNLTFGNRKVTDKFGFNVAYRWQDEFLWESSFAQGLVPAIGTFDAQVSYRLKDLKSVIKLGGSNLFNERYVLNYGGPTLGGIYYISVTFDELMK